jgi:hypothetical protein
MYQKMSQSGHRITLEKEKRLITCTRNEKKVNICLKLIKTRIKLEVK